MGKADNIAKDLQPLAVPITSLQPYGNNSRRRTDANLAAIRASFDTFGQQRPILVYRFGKGEPPTVIAGNGGFLAAKGLGWSKIAASHFRGTAAEARAYAIADNRIAELSEWDADVLGSEALALRGQAELDSMLDALHLEDILGGDEPEAVREDEMPEPPKDPITKPGDLWALGAHRLLCGDSTREADVQRLMGDERAGLMNTDPPYGVAYANDDRPNPGVAKARVANDRLEDETLQAFLESAFRPAKDLALLPNAAWYLWHAHLTQGFFAAAAAAAAAQVVLHRQIIWVKPSLLLTRGQYHWKHEPCFMGWVQGHQPPDYGRGRGERDQTTVWEIDGISVTERRTLNHSTPKPVEIFRIPIVKHLRVDEIAYEPFAGSGPQFIAAEVTGRRCFGIELEPAFCDVIVQRWERFTGGKATRS